MADKDNLEDFTSGHESFKRKANALVAAARDYKTRIEKLEIGSGGRELEFNGCENGLEATFWIRARRGTAAV